MELARRFVRFVVRSMGEAVPDDVKIVPVPHHLAHAASAYYFSGFNNAAVLTVDGYGEFEATVVWRVKSGEFEKMADAVAKVLETRYDREEIRWTRHKHSIGEPPINALRQAFLFRRRKYGIKTSRSGCICGEFRPTTHGTA